MMNVDSFQASPAATPDKSLSRFYELWAYPRVGCAHQKTERPARHA